MLNWKQLQAVCDWRLHWGRCNKSGIDRNRTSSEEAIRRLHQDIAACRRCALAQTRTFTVPGEGPVAPRAMMVGEAPGEQEDLQGRPFVGRAGRILDDLLVRAGLERSRIFITSLVKCRPPSNRDPKPAELEACKPHLDRQLELLHPQLILTLGRFAMARWLPGRKISAVHGQVFAIEGIRVVPLFHPGAALHQPRYRALMIQDMDDLAGVLQDNGNPAFGSSAG